MKFRWTLAPSQPLLAGQLAASLKISPLLAQCLLNRGLSEPAAVEMFLSPRLKNLADPFLLPNMGKAVERLFCAREQNEPLVIFGDYDVDGVTSTTLLLEVLRSLGWQADAYLPNRMDEGYGLSRDGVDNCLKKFPVKLLLAVDCGSTAVETISWLRETGVEVIVLDHHQVSDPAPEAVALVNPQLSALNSQPSTGFTELCSAGLAFKLAHAILKRGRENNLPGAAEYDLKPPLPIWFRSPAKIEFWSPPACGS
jgi:single-stranded-DNA-specific exonuclease